ncbi:MAG: cyclase/dehydrase [Myxococcaceae bacterium]|nr:cyclase/dehydrase [Myxococcaceae bacterium]
MPKSSTSFESFVSPEELRAVVIDVEKYPAFLPEVKKVVVRSRHEDGFLATFFVEVKVSSIEVKTEYTVRYTLKPLEVSWTLEESPNMSKNEGTWRFEEIKDGETKAFYEAEIETSLPIAPELQKMFADNELPRMMQRFRDRAEA